MENPNEYNDDAFVAASLEFQANASEGIEDLWKTGARLHNIEEDIATAVNMALNVSCTVAITITSEPEPALAA